MLISWLKIRSYGNMKIIVLKMYMKMKIAHRSDSIMTPLLIPDHNSTPTQVFRFNNRFTILVQTSRKE